ncbi:zinc finger CCCH domain-containing protein 14 isoform X2 [Anthonomus grandis grandis]|uniref:zinc finger CCCH domain-containing protein 14 isoform X2 n=1 Tax=Anthonomus grandis grandis TaxID=2921223 RepID=UPI002165DD89|nr:zinc finger CCCH domain-containing protein 14 isoform X2 [Anthonomus grandis grandis]
MDSIGAEVGQKMRSAIKAKLLELECYVDDELPDYIMVMVANRRTKSQMNEDLNLFLSTKTSTFVNWLHIVLKKLKEVTVTNPEVYKKAVKRKSGEVPPDDKSCLKVKKEKSHKKVKKESLLEKSVRENNKEDTQLIPQTDDPPVSSNKLSENRKIIIEHEDNNRQEIAEDSFDIPLLSEVGEMNEKELEDIEKKIKSVKSRLGLLVNSDTENDHENVKSEEENSLAKKRQISVLENAILESNDEENSLLSNREVELDAPESEDKPKHKRITFDFEPESVSLRSRLENRHRNRSRERSPRTPPPRKKVSVLERLEKRPSPSERSRGEHREKDRRNSRRRSTSRDRDRYQRPKERSRDREKRSKSRSPVRSREKSAERTKKIGILGRLGVQSKVAVIKRAAPQKSDSEEEPTVREVRSAIKVKPRVLPVGCAQPNKNLLLKAVADAQRSVAQTPTVGKEVAEKLFTKKYVEKRQNSTSAAEIHLETERKSEIQKIIRQSSSRMRSRLEKLSSDEEQEVVGYDLREYVPRNSPKYVPSSKSSLDTESKENNVTRENGHQQFIITLDGVEKPSHLEKKITIKTRLERSVANKKRSPSPIVFDKQKNVAKNVKASRQVPDKLPVVRPSPSLKNKERCRYWPNCRQGDKCEFVHPSETCQMFPLCKFGVNCLYIHPKCKFRSSCTKKDCPYDHGDVGSNLTGPKSSPAPPPQNCKFYPNCTNLNCPFFHPKTCKYGKYCKNFKDCPFSHHHNGSIHKSLTWKAK